MRVRHPNVGHHASGQDGQGCCQAGPGKTPNPPGGIPSLVGLSRVTSLPFIEM